MFFDLLVISVVCWDSSFVPLKTIPRMTNSIPIKNLRAENSQFSIWRISERFCSWKFAKYGTLGRTERERERGWEEERESLCFDKWWGIKWMTKKHPYMQIQWKKNVQNVEPDMVDCLQLLLSMYVVFIALWRAIETREKKHRKQSFKNMQIEMYISIDRECGHFSSLENCNIFHQLHQVEKTLFPLLLSCGKLVFIQVKHMEIFSEAVFQESQTYSRLQG